MLIHGETERIIMIVYVVGLAVIVITALVVALIVDYRRRSNRVKNDER